MQGAQLYSWHPASGMRGLVLTLEIKTTPEPAFRECRSAVLPLEETSGALARANRVDEYFSSLTLPRQRHPVGVAWEAHWRRLPIP
jgi:hypothetical protein